MYYIVDVLYYFAVLLLLVNVSTIFNNISFGYKAIIIIIEKKKQDSQLIIVSTSISIASIFTIYTFMHSLHILKQTCDTYIIIDIVITELSLVIIQNYVKCPLKSNFRGRRCLPSTGEAGKVYLGSTDGTFRSRYCNHRTLFKLAKIKNSTRFASYVWELKEEKNDKIVLLQNWTEMKVLAFRLRNRMSKWWQKLAIMKYPNPNKLDEIPGVKTECKPCFFLLLLPSQTVGVCIWECDRMEIIEKF